MMAHIMTVGGCLCLHGAHMIQINGSMCKLHMKRFCQAFCLFLFFQFMIIIKDKNGGEKRFDYEVKEEKNLE